MRLHILYPAVFVMSIINLVNAQEKINNASLYKVIYIAKHLYDTRDLTKVKTDSMAVYAGRTRIVFTGIPIMKDPSKGMHRLHSSLHNRQ